MPFSKHIGTLWEGVAQLSTLTGILSALGGFAETPQDNQQLQCFLYVRTYAFYHLGYHLKMIKSSNLAINSKAKATQLILGILISD